MVEQCRSQTRHNAIGGVPILIALIRMPGFQTLLIKRPYRIVINKSWLGFWISKSVGAPAERTIDLDTVRVLQTFCPGFIVKTSTRGRI